LCVVSVSLPFLTKVNVEFGVLVLKCLIRTINTSFLTLPIKTKAMDESLSLFGHFVGIVNHILN
jgi:hypothetical protein